MRGKTLPLLLSTVVVLCGWWLWSSETGKMLTGRWSFTEKAVVDRGTYFRLKVDLTYNGEPQHFDIVVGCNVLDVLYKDNSSTREVGLVPTLYGRRMSDGKGLVVRAPDACDGETTANGEVPANFTPLIIVYEDADSLEFGTAYMSEDAYDSPLSQLRFGKASIEAATRSEFEAFRRDGPPNLVRREQYGYPQDRDPQGPARIWPGIAVNCYAVKRFQIPESGKDKLRDLRPAGAQRFWTVAPTGKAPLSGIGYQRDDGGPIDPYGDTFVGETLSDNGAPRRNGDGVIRGKRLPASYYPISIPEYGVPTGHGAAPPPPVSQDGAKPDYLVDAHVDGGRYRGFAYCFSPQKLDPFSKVTQRIDGVVAQRRPAQSQLNFGLLFEEDRYFYTPMSIHLDTTRGDV